MLDNSNAGEVIEVNENEFKYKETNSEKGKKLERAVLAIEKAILAKVSGFENIRMVVMPNKIVTVDDVKSEADIYVHVEIISGYELVHIFECKNWARPAGKTTVINCIDKLDAFNASKCFILAKKFTKDAVARAKRDKRIFLVQVDDLSEVAIAQVPPIIVMTPRLASSTTDFLVQDCLDSESYVEDGVITIEEFDIPVVAYLDSLYKEVVNCVSSHLKFRHNETAIYEIPFEIEPIKMKNAYLNGYRLYGLILKGVVSVAIDLGTDVIAFRVDGRGQFVRMTTTISTDSLKSVEMVIVPQNHSGIG